MVLVCVQGNGTQVFDDGGDNWIVKVPNKQDDIIPKKKRPFFPLTLVTRYGATAMNKETIQKLEKQLGTMV